MAKFVICSGKEVRYMRDIISNCPVNIERCSSIQKQQYANYPDSKGVPSIVFVFEKDHKITWIYKDKTERDNQFNEIIKSNIN